MLGLLCTQWEDQGRVLGYASSRRGDLQAPLRRTCTPPAPPVPDSGFSYSQRVLWQEVVCFTVVFQAFTKEELPLNTRHYVNEFLQPKNHFGRCC